MTVKTKIFVSNSLNPWFNLAMEDWLFSDLKEPGQVLFLWRNHDTVVIGQSQNPWVECQLERMKENGVKLARRQSGGGAVFHDMGNTNFTFISAKQDYNQSLNTEIIMSALSCFGLKPAFKGRNDLVLPVGDGEYRKISGSAFKETRDRAFHHGTVLIDADLAALSNYLQPNLKKLQAKGIKSVRSRVMNCVEAAPNMTHELLCSEIVREFSRQHSHDHSIEFLSEDDTLRFVGLEARVKKMSSDDWLYSQTLPFNQQIEERFDWGGIDVRLDVQGGSIVSAQVFSDCLSPEFISSLECCLSGINYSVSAIKQALTGLPKSYDCYAVDVIPVILSSVA